MTNQLDERWRLEADYEAYLAALPYDDVIVEYCQGNLLKGYNMAFLRHLVVQVGDAAAARQFLFDVSDESSDGPRITTGREWERQAGEPLDPSGAGGGLGSDPESVGAGCALGSDPMSPARSDATAYELGRVASNRTSWHDGKPATCLNVGISATGLRALGLNDASYRTFPEEFRQGAAERAKKIGDVDGSRPKLWRDGFDDEDNVHVMWTVHAGTKPNLQAACEDLERRWQRSGAFVVISRLDGAKLPDKETGKPGHDVHFGYRDDISQPRFKLSRTSGELEPRDQHFGRRDAQPPVAPGALIQGVTGPTSFAEVQWQVPELVTAAGGNPKLSQFGCYCAFRVMEQDVDAFEDFLEEEADHLGWNKEYLAGKLMGRWRNGVPIVFTKDHTKWSAPTAPMPDPRHVGLDQTDPCDDGLNNFDYPDEIDGLSDLEGGSCPVGSHIRRSNPRGGRIVQRSANHTRQLVRRGMPYGPPFDPDSRGDGHKRGLLGSFFCGSLIGQLESMMYDWINLGLQDPRITGTNCPIIGANKKATSRFDIPLDPDPADPDRPERVTIRGFPRFVETVGAAYFFYPGIPGLQLLATMKQGE